MAANVRGKLALHPYKGVELLSYFSLYFRVFDLIRSQPLNESADSPHDMFAFFWGVVTSLI